MNITLKRRSNRIKNIIMITALTAIILGVSTYAWFVGIRTVNISSFDVEIAVTDSLMVSLDGATWDSTISISKDTLDAVSYVGHTNSWGGAGLIPVSTIGEMDVTSSRMKIFEKASLNPTPGGYRLMASRMDNYSGGQPEQDGYVVFDLFIRNFTGSEYIEDPSYEEPIYLTVDSIVDVAATGVQDTGIENSVRVAFSQIGRVSGDTTNASTITGIDCTGGGEVTGICRAARIWEPNDRKHVDDAIRWYDTSCQARTGVDVTKAASYSGSSDCSAVVDGLAYKTYAISDVITSSDNVDVYDGADYNGYADSTPLLTETTPLTDTQKLLAGTARPTFMTLAPTSITKVRVYIWIEGQDVDNYDFASIGKKIAVKFGFTKQRFTEDDIDYNGPDVNQGDGPSGSDLTAPVITLTGDNPLILAHGTPFVDPGATAVDNVDGDLTGSIQVSGTVNENVDATYNVLYTVTDAAGNTATKVRSVIVQSG